jgi:hypothetical protein
VFVTEPTVPLALADGVGLEICRALIDVKLEGRERLVRERLIDSATPSVIAALRDN